MFPEMRSLVLVARLEIFIYYILLIGLDTIGTTIAIYYAYQVLHIIFHKPNVDVQARC